MFGSVNISGPSPRVDVQFALRVLLLGFRSVLCFFLGFRFLFGSEGFSESLEGFVCIRQPRGAGRLMLVSEAMDKARTLSTRELGQDPEDGAEPISLGLLNVGQSADVPSPGTH